MAKTEFNPDDIAAFEALELLDHFDPPADPISTRIYSAVSEKLETGVDAVVRAGQTLSSEIMDDPKKGIGTFLSGAILATSVVAGVTESAASAATTDARQNSAQVRPQSSPPSTRDEIVKKGDTLIGIAQKNHKTEAEIAAANPLVKDKNHIFIGERVHIPDQKAALPNTVDIIAGDSPYRHWDLTGRKMNWLDYRAAWNRLNGTKLVPGQKVIDPASVTTIPTITVPLAPPKTATSPNNSFKYPAAKGDSVDAIGEGIAHASGRSIPEGDKEALAANHYHYLMHPNDILDLTPDLTPTQAFAFMSYMNAHHHHPSLAKILPPTVTQPQAVANVAPLAKPEVSPTHVLNITVVTGDSSRRITESIHEATGLPISKIEQLFEAINHIHNHRLKPGDHEVMPFNTAQDELKSAVILNQKRGRSGTVGSHNSATPHNEIPAPPKVETAIPPDLQALSARVGFTVNPKFNILHDIKHSGQLQNVLAHPITDEEIKLHEQGFYTRLSDARQPSGLTADQYRQIFRLHGATKELEDTADIIPELEKRLGVTGVMGIEHLINESSAGHSEIAIRTHNVSGDTAYDSCPATCAHHFNSVQESVIHYFEHISRDYLDQTGMWYSGDTKVANVFVAYSSAGQKQAESLMSAANSDLARIRVHPSQAAPVPLPPNAEKSPAPMITAEQAIALQHIVDRDHKIASDIQRALTFKGSPHQPNDAYKQAIQDKRNQGIFEPFGGQDCADFVGTVVPELPANGTMAQQTFAEEHPELFNVFTPKSKSELKSGDVLVVNVNGGEGANGHILIYVGPQPDGTDGVAASGGGAWPRGIVTALHDHRGNFKVIRRK